MTDGRDGSLPEAARLLFDELAGAEANPSLPRVVVLYGETGRGKTYAVQRFYDELCRLRPGHWAQGLTPPWPPRSTSGVNRGRKRIAGRADPAAAGSMPFFWLGVESYAYGRDPNDPVPSAGQQLHAMFRAALTRSEKQKKITKQVFKAGLDIIGALVTPIGIGKSVYDHAVAAWSLSRSVDELEEQRQAVHKGFAAAAQATGSKVPMIVIVDDAQDVDHESLYLLSALIAQTPDVGGDVDGRYLPHVLDRTLPAPLLIVCTAWEHRVVGTAYREPFQVWLDELESLGVDVVFHLCREFDVSTASSILGDWKDVPDEVRHKLLEHMSYSVDQRASINPLVLNLGVARLEERRDPFSGQINASASEIAALPVTPEEHIRDRLERVRAEESGDIAVGIMELCSALGGYFVPVRFLEFATEAIGAARLAESLALLDRHELAVPAWGKGTHGQRYELRSYQFDVDVLRYMSGQPLPAIQTDRLASMCTQFLEWAYFELMRSDFSTEMQPDEVVDSICLPMANVVLAQPGGNPASDAMSVARVLLRVGAPDTDVISARGMGFAFARGAIGRLDDDVLLTAFSEMWPSRIALRIAERRLTDGTSDLEEHIEAELLRTLHANSAIFDVAVVAARVYQRHWRTAEAVELMEPHAADSLEAAIIQAECYDRSGRGDLAIAALACHDTESAVLKRAKLMSAYGRKADAVRELDAIVAVSETAAIALARLLERDDLERAMQVLEPYADGSGEGARSTLAQLISWKDPNRALAMLADVKSEQGIAVAAKLHEAAGQHSDAMRLMALGSERSSNIAIEYAQALIASGDEPAAIETLRGHVTTASNAATTLAELLAERGDIAGAIDVLRPVADRFRNAATLLAGYLQRHEPEEAVRLLSLWADNADGYRSLALLLLRCGRPHDALQILNGRLRRAQDRRSQVMRAAAYFFEGDFKSARRTFATLERNPRMPEYYRLAALFAGQGRVDLMAELLRGRLFQRDRVVADFALRAVVRAGGGAPEVTEYCCQLWPPGGRRSDARRKLIGSLWSWARDRDSVVPDMDAEKALSCVEVVAATGGIRPELRAAMHDAFVIDSSNNPKTAPRLAYFAEISDVARDVSEELSRARPGSIE